MENFQRFYQCYLRDVEEHKNDRDVTPVKASPNNFIIACIPWFTFNSLSMHLQNAKNYYAPIFESGGFVEKDGVTTMPLSITVNHATIDGYHIKVFLEELQRMMDHPEEWM